MRDALQCDQHGPARQPAAAGGEEPQRFNVLGVHVSAVNLSRTVKILNRWISRGETHYVCVTGVHGVMEAVRSPTLRQVHNLSGVTTPDGMPLVWLGRLAGHRHVSRVYGPDLMIQVCELASKRGYRSFLYGGAEGVADSLSEALKSRFGALNICGTYCPPFRPLTDEENDQVVGQINRSEADIVWVGLSTPKQEIWMARNRARLRAPVLIGVGAAFDFHTGRVRQAPAWIQRSGFEWLFRMLTEPRRLWRRYARNNPAFLWNLALQLTSIRRY